MKIWGCYSPSKQGNHRHLSKLPLLFVWIGLLVIVLINCSSFSVLATTQEYEHFLANGLKYEDYENGLKMSINQRVSHTRVIDYIDATLIQPLEISKNLSTEIMSGISHLYDTYDITTIAEQFGVNTDYINNLRDLKKNSQAEIISKLDELALVKKMINQVISFSNSSINTFHTKMIPNNISTSQDFHFTNREIGTNDQVPTARFLKSDNSQFYLEKSGTIVKQIRNFLSGGESHFMVILGNGKLYTTGRDSYSVGVLGRKVIGSAIRYCDFIPLASSGNIYQVETYSNTNLVLTEDGLYSFGSNSNGQLGTGNRINSLSPVKVNGFMGKKVEQIASGSQSSYAITTDGELWAWGDNTRGQLGDATQEEKFRPFKVFKNNGPLKNKKVVKVCAGDSFALVLTSENTLVSFGDNTYGQLGRGTIDPSLYISPVEVPRIGALSGVTIADIQCGSRHVVVLTTEGKIVSWGYNGEGQLGDGSSNKTKVDPQLLSTPCTVRRVYSKHNSTIFICTNSKMYGYGRNSNGELGLGSATVSVTTPTQYSSLSSEFVDSIIDIATTSGSSALLTREGYIYYSGSTFSTTVFRTITSFSNSFKKDSMYSFTYLPWHLRQSPFFKLNGIGYLLNSEKNFYSRNGIEFGYYISADPDNLSSTWQQISPSLVNNNTISPYSVINNTLYGKSIYNTHIIRIKEYIYMIGGFVNNEISNTIYRTPISNPLFGWERLDQKLPFPLASGMLFSDTTYVYIIGGIKQTHLYNSSRDIDPIEKLDLSQTTVRARLDSDLRNWEIMFNSKFPSTLHSGFVYKGDSDSNYYILGGLKSLDSGPSNKIYSTPDMVVWSKQYELPFYTNAGSSIFSRSSNDMVFTGVSTSGRVVGPKIFRTTKTNFPNGWIGGSSAPISTICSSYPSICGE